LGAGPPLAIPSPTAALQSAYKMAAATPNPSGATTVSQVTNAPRQVGQSYADLYQKAAPGVVFIAARGDQGGGVGSGVVLDQDGHILTNNHVVEGAQSLVVRLDDGTEGSAKVLGRDPS